MFRKKNILKAGLLIAIGSLFVGCGSSNFHRVSPDYEQSMKSNNNFLLVVDNCIKSDYTGDGTVT